MKLDIAFKPIRKAEGKPPLLLFLDVHDENGKSVSVGEWIADGDYEVLRIDTQNPLNLKLAPYNEADDFILEAADQYGFEETDGDVDGFVCTREQLISLVRAAREQGEQDAREALSK